MKRLHTWQRRGYFLQNPKQSKKKKPLKNKRGFKKERPPQILSNFFSSLWCKCNTFSRLKNLHSSNAQLCRYTHTHHVIMAGPNAAMLLSSKGGAFNSAQFVAGSRRKSSSKKKSCARAGFFSKDDDFETSTEEQSSSSLAGKAVSAVVAAAISLSSAGQAAALSSSSQVQLVRFSFFLATMCIFLFLLLVEKKDRIVFSPFWI